MTRLIALHVRRYEAFGQLVRDDLPRLPQTKARVWNAFTRHSGLSDADAAEALRFGTDPIVFVERMPGLFGLFDPGRPGVISIARRLVDPPEQFDALKAEATVLHELVHWAWHRAGRREPQEMGRLFEREAYPRAGGAPIVVEHARGLVGADRQAPAELGELSRAYESNGKPWAIGFDETGGWSYGLYQLASKRGSVAAFLDHLRHSAGEPDHARFAAALESAGGDAGARFGSRRFQDAWTALAAEQAFAQAQHDFIEHSHYAPFVRALARQGFDVDARSPVIKDVAWSIAVQHGQGGTVIFSRALAAMPADRRDDDRALVDAVYDERSKVDVYFASSTAQVRASVRQRFAEERAAALARL